MVPVTAWTRKVKQPRGGYLPVKSMRVERFDDGRELHPNENLSAGTVGTAVDYLSRVLSGHDAKEVFALPLAGAEKLDKTYFANKYLSEVIMFADDGDICPELIRAGVNLSRFDVVFKTGNAKYLSALNGAVVIDDETVENIEIMLSRILAFRKRNGLLDAKAIPVQSIAFPGLTGEDRLCGEIDILGESSLWDCKAMSTKLRATYTAQLLAYYVMLYDMGGMRCSECVRLGGLNPITQTDGDFLLGFFNPRENAEYSILVSQLDPVMFEKLEADMVNLEYMY